MSKKIALLLIVFMIGSLCVYADDDYTTILWVTLGALGAVSIVGITLAIAEEDYDTAQEILDAWAEGKPEKGNPVLTAEAKINPLLKCTALGVTKDKVFMGFKFSW